MAKSRLEEVVDFFFIPDEADDFIAGIQVLYFFDCHDPAELPRYGLSKLVEIGAGLLSLQGAEYFGFRFQLKTAGLKI